jgi:hypothetical protein|tara:strand:- start:3075 stop:3239 length:165 start_codon:yes stop_codon:yes gene_type:complete
LAKFSLVISGIFCYTINTNDEKGKQEKQVSRQTHYTQRMVAGLLALEKAKGETW